MDIQAIDLRFMSIYGLLMGESLNNEGVEMMEILSRLPISSAKYIGIHVNMPTPIFIFIFILFYFSLSLFFYIFCLHNSQNTIFVLKSE